MNLIDATVSQEGSQAVLKMSEEVTIKLPAEKSKKLIDEGYVGKTVVVGIRPEDVKDDPEFIAAHQDTKFKSTIRVYTNYLVQKLTFTMKSVMLHVQLRLILEQQLVQVMKLNSLWMLQDFMYLIRKQKW